MFVSYGWAHEREDPLVQALCAGLAEHGIQVIRDIDAARPGDRISEFIERIGAGRCAASCR